MKLPLILGLIAIIASAALAEEAARPVTAEAEVLSSGRMSARRKALQRLGSHTDAAADDLLAAEFQKLRSGELPPGLWLDLLEAMAARKSERLNALLAARETELAKSPDPLARFRECLEGGDGEKGRAVFMGKPEAGCVRCHAIEGKGGKVGPDLAWLRNATERAHILESIVAPNSTIATGFQSALLRLKDGREIGGIVTAETPQELTITSVADGAKTKIETREIEERTALPSPMPPHFGVVLDKRTIRDLVEFIAKGD